MYNEIKYLELDLKVTMVMTNTPTVRDLNQWE